MSRGMQILIGTLLAAVLGGVALLAYLITADPLQIGPTVQRATHAVHEQLERAPSAGSSSAPLPAATSSSSEFEGGGAHATTSGSGAALRADTEPASTSDQGGHPLLTDGQEAVLRLVGIDPASLPERATPTQISCFKEVVGDERYDAIVSGGTPTLGEVWRARSCL
ncbi:hypothetical protein GVX82_00315 [Patescibacteria group bacterium]|nr:hypothetical protein [Patescibacteria group bacterium]